MRHVFPVIETVKKEKKLDEYENGGKLDAFRHIFSMAFLAQKISSEKLISLGIAHEKGNREQFEKGQTENGELPDSVSCEMDLRNNSIGIGIGKKYLHLGIDSLKNLIIGEIILGNAWIILRNDTGKYIDCSKNAILGEERKKYWNVPKCLVNSGKNKQQ
jgi:hypothetical protein